jgi:hypothetical protein
MPGGARERLESGLLRVGLENPTGDCRKTIEELKRRGVGLVSDVLEFPWG